ncbi:BURP DOMAIN PROTEIN USPL1-LIKE [Salix viminalis]|uniref:BURP DOMAIN PROTEIN USPL1-LIKE n=1 Tax=Salix viminalis TaxID=40686 RepID=A0A9Q0SEH4_SALVM|nr:BURP DOMAIN PROTEIN USPL1-LIKE [Salix viminalis]
MEFALVGSHAALPPELYWNNELPDTPMPKPVRDLLHPDLVDYKSTSVAVGKGGVIVNSGKGKPGGGTHVVTGGKGGGVNPGPNPSIYKYAATETQVHDDPGKMMNLQFTENTNTATFLPRQVAGSIPF